MIPLPTFTDKRGTLTVAEAGLDVTFPIQRVFWVYEMKQMRGGHAHRECTQMLVAVAGEVAVSTSQGKGPVQTTLLNRRDQALVVPPGVFVYYSGLPGSVLMVLSSKKHDPDDIIPEKEPV